jgi:putative alpha-1,2-mannosidase
LVNSAKVQVAPNKYFTVKVKNQGKNNIYIKSLSLNGKQLTQPFINHKDVADGGSLVFEMSDVPNKELFK